MNVFKYLLVLGTLLLGAACGAENPLGADEPVGNMELALSVPADSTATCVQVTVRNVKNDRSHSVVVALEPGAEQTVDLGWVPAGDDEISAFMTAGFTESACTGTHSYEAEVTPVRVAPGETVHTTLAFQARGDVVIDGEVDGPNDIYEEPAECANPVNVALGTDASLSDDGWGGGTSKADLTDGLTQYCDTWAHGLAATGGLSNWAGYACGYRQWTLDLGSPHTVAKAQIFHHGDYHIPGDPTLEGSLDGSSWFPLASDGIVRNDLRTDATCYGAVPTEHTFAPTTLRFFRYSFDNCNMLNQTTDSHGWAYEIEIFECQ